jgi:hypothetical protein
MCRLDLIRPPWKLGLNIDSHPESGRLAQDTNHAECDPDVAPRLRSTYNWAEVFMIDAIDTG